VWRMSERRPFVLSIAGFDPSGGAGILADIKTFEMHQTCGLGVCTSVTFQNEHEFQGVEWLPFNSIQKQLDILFRKYNIDVVKIGLIESFFVLNGLLDHLLKFNPDVKIIWDPVLTASAGFDFHPHPDQSLLLPALTKICLVTPNLAEATRLAAGKDALTSAGALNRYCNVYVKGGHSDSDADDFLFCSSNAYRIEGKKIKNGEKHGSGCVLSSAIAANLANGMTLLESCEKAKIYMSHFLKSSNTLLGYHYSNH
jgi:hydroxymethylpyrimidine/phosphomethylpyrimidine kinase